VGDIFGRLHLSGFLAWLAWLGIHIFFLIGFRNRLAVMFGWAYSYLTWRRGARLITDPVLRSRLVHLRRHGRAVDEDRLKFSWLCEQRLECVRQDLLFVVGRHDDADHAEHQSGKNIRTSCAQAVASSSMFSNRSQRVRTMASVSAR